MNIIFWNLCRFTFKVTVLVQGAKFIPLECFGYPKAQKKAAEESAAEAALWFLKHIGYVPKA